MNARSAQSSAVAIRLPRMQDAPADRLASSHSHHAHARMTIAVALVLALLALVLAASPVFAQQNQQEGQRWVDPASLPGGAWLAAIAADNTPIRCGSADTYYPFALLKRDQLVVVREERFNWARIASVGPAFDELFGHVNYHESDAGRFQVSPDGRTLRLMGRGEVLAPNVTEKADPLKSWRPIARLDVGATLTILRTQRIGEQISHTVALPTEAAGWMLASQLRPATAAEREQWKQTMQRRLQPGGTPSGGASNSATVTNDTAAARQSAAEPTQAGRPTPAQPPATERDQAISQAGTSTPAGRTADPAADRTASLPVLPRAEPGDLPVVTGADMSTVIYADGTTARQPPPQAQPGRVALEAPATGSAGAKSPRNELKDLEELFEALAAEPIESAEVEPLRRLYTAFASRAQADHERLASFARARAEQLAIWQTLQQQKRELAELRLRIDQQTEDVQIVQRALQGTGSYTAVGRLMASTIYDGARLPRLFRMQDPGTGRTVAYLEPDASFDLPGLLGQLIGVVGDRDYDPSLRLNVVKPRRIDLLSPREGTATTLSTANSGQP